ncbi:SPOR domain-containing protein [Saccharospirillum impatiens]|uniref:SPOR domain-containing protein n=1 Tax=Saccharospirillum impatiens TaxID=169438 RepID=UPI0004222201|nr:SPOR domain-containing protein [Saccharospirillum impatiens]
MDVRIQQRLVGALVILALVFLIAPVVLDGNGRIPEKITQIPPKPKRPDVSHIRVAEPAADVLPALPDPPAAEPESTAPIPEPAAAEPASPVEAETSAVEQDDPVATPTGRAWSVQVASFRDSSKAAELRDRLRDQDYSTYVNEVLLSDGSVFTQVLVGPDGDLERVRDMQQNILEQTGLQGLVVRFQP